MKFNKNLLRVLVLKDFDSNQEQIAGKIGVCSSTFSFWMNGKVEPEEYNVKKIAGYFGIDIKEFFRKTTYEQLKKKYIYGEG